MSSEMESLLQTFRAQNKTAFVLGYTGEVGKEVVKAIVSSRAFAKVTLIGRRTIAYEDPIYKDVVSYFIPSRDLLILDKLSFEITLTRRVFLTVRSHNCLACLCSP